VIGRERAGTVDFFENFFASEISVWERALMVGNGRRGLRPDGGLREKKKKKKKKNVKIYYVSDLVPGRKV